ncbi:carnosine N-methyltransferase [Galendromus occidentalis]|uniref:carnosine N-methyltransferase n=1 Tax=Galendromus occidentalis TaxID=34638 RepID=A0AAJ6QSV6_9ACAR|nr:carnosine N-methyltransferase [Galendromus occidentalis]
MAPEASRHHCALASLISTVNVLSSYKRIQHDKVARSCSFIERMQPQYSEYLINYHRFLHTVRVGVNQNFAFLQEVLENIPRTLGSMIYIPRTFEIDPKSKPSHSEVEELLLVLKEVRREWSAEGRSERDQYYIPLLQRAEALFPKHRSDVRVLVPGQRLGRLVFELVKRGFRCEGHESSYLRAAFACFILSNPIPDNHYTIHPFLHCLSANLRDEDRTRMVHFPDENPNAILSQSSLCSFVLGDFTNGYKHQAGEWDLVVTCLFLQTEPNVIGCMEVIFDCLRPGGHWLNLGSLASAYHKRKNQALLTPSHEDMRHIIEEIGFIVTEEGTEIRGTFCATQSSMRQVQYRNVLLVCRKPADVGVQQVKTEVVEDV